MDAGCAWVSTRAGTQLDVDMMDALNPALQQLTIAERIGEMELSGRRGAVKGAASLQTDSFAVLLVQGLESNDAHILNVSASLSERIHVIQVRLLTHINTSVSALPESSSDS